MAKGNAEPGRISSKITLVKAVELIASDRLRDTSKKPARWVFKMNPEAVKILLNITRENPSEGWKMLYGCDRMQLYGSQIPLAWQYCHYSPEDFIEKTAAQDAVMLSWIDSHR